MRHHKLFAFQVHGDLHDESLDLRLVVTVKEQDAADSIDRSAFLTSEYARGVRVVPGLCIR